MIGRRARERGNPYSYNTLQPLSSLLLFRKNHFISAFATEIKSLKNFLKRAIAYYSLPKFLIVSGPNSS